MSMFHSTEQKFILCDKFITIAIMSMECSNELPKQRPFGITKEECDF